LFEGMVVVVFVVVLMGCLVDMIVVVVGC